MSAPAGWHPQGDGRERFWDGSQWTDQFRTPTAPDDGAGTPSASAAARRSWFVRHKVMTGLGALLLVGVAAAAATGGGGGTGDSRLTAGNSPSSSHSSAPTTGAPSPSSSTAATPATPSASSKTPAQSPAKAAPKSAPPAASPPLTGQQKNAARSAQDYLAMSGFSRLGLIEQLSSSAGDGYSRKDATVAVDSLHVNWYAQAVRSAKDYLSMSGFSCSGLIEQLSSSAGDRYTHAQASYGAHHAGAC